MKKQKKDNSNIGAQLFLATLDPEMTMYDQILNAIFDCEKYKWGNEVLDHLIIEIRKRYDRR